MTSTLSQRAARRRSGLRRATGDRRVPERDTLVTLREDVQPMHLGSEHHAAQLIERIGWAVADAEADQGTRPAIAR